MRTKKPCASPSGCRRWTGLLPLLAVTVFLSGCSHYAAVKIESEPQGAEVVNVDTDVVMGTTPLTYWWETGSSERVFVNVRFQKPGYEDKPSAFYINPRHKSHTEAVRDPHYIKVTLDEEN